MCYCDLEYLYFSVFFFSSRRRHTRCALVTGVQTCALPISFEPEYVNAFEIGMKNSLAGGKLMLNATAFLNLYKDYQVSQIVDRISLNENFDATTWGLEFEAAWRPSRNFRIDKNLEIGRAHV